jgi:hypothetical protein
MGWKFYIYKSLLMLIIIILTSMVDVPTVNATEVQFNLVIKPIPVEKLHYIEGFPGEEDDEKIELFRKKLWNYI